MGASERYAIAWKGLKLGRYVFDFEIDGTLFEECEAAEIRGAACTAHVTLDRGEAMLSLHVAVDGEATVPCDRCLEDCSVPVRFDGDLLVKFSDEERESDGEVMWISPADETLSLEQYLYESVILSLPYRRVHPEGGCDPDMTSRFRVVSAEEFEAMTERSAEAAVPMDGEAAERLEALRERLEAEERTKD